MNTSTEEFGFKELMSTLKSIYKAMKLTITQAMFEKENTLQYPFIKKELPEKSRGMLFNNVSDCIACDICADACPVDCIYIVHEKRKTEEVIPKTSKGKPIVLRLTKFKIDMALCCHCGLCTEVCPTDCLVHTKQFDYVTDQVKSHLVDYLK